MKIIIAGSRTITDYDIVFDALFHFCWDNKLELEGKLNVPEIVSGHAKGVDIIGEKIAKNHNLKVTIFPADWNKYGKRAGYLRNEQMADYADALIAIWDGKSKGTKHMIDIAKRKGLKVYIHDNTKN